MEKVESLDASDSRMDAMLQPAEDHSSFVCLHRVLLLLLLLLLFCIFIREKDGFLSFSCLALLGFFCYLFGFDFSVFSVEIFRVLMENELLIFLADRDLGVDLGHDSFDLILCKSQIGIDLLLVNFVGLGKREHGDETKDHESESVEPGADVSHNPKEDAEFDGVDHVLDKDQSAEFTDVSGHVRRDDFSIFLGLLRADGQVHLQILSERMAFIALLNGGQSPLVDGVRESHRQHCEGDVRDDREHGEDGEGDEEEEGRSGDDRRLLDVLPVDQIHDLLLHFVLSTVFCS